MRVYAAETRLAHQRRSNEGAESEYPQIFEGKHRILVDRRCTQCRYLPTIDGTNQFLRRENRIRTQGAVKIGSWAASCMATGP